MNSNLSAYIKNYAATTIRNRMNRFLCAGVALFVVSGAIPRAGADDNNGFLPNQMIVSTVPANGDVNPYGVAFVPQGFQRGNGPLQPGDILVSNFNNSSNLQGTGTTLCVFLGVARSHFSLRQRLPRQAQPAMAYRQLWQCCAKASSLSEACRQQMERLRLLAPVDYS